MEDTRLIKIQKCIEKLRLIDDFAIEICEEFEDLLESKDITIPNEDRIGEDGEARIFADDWTQILESTKYYLQKFYEKLTTSET